jgi:hypothetical protein
LSTQLSVPVNPAAISNGEGDALAEIDELMKKHRDDEQRSDRLSSVAEAEASEFSKEFERVCQDQVRPAMEAVIARLRINGGGGSIEERPEDMAKQQTHQLTLWMSLDGEIAGRPRPDVYPHLQLDAHVDKRWVSVSEGDMWRGHGATSAAQRHEWQLPDITAALVIQQAVAILRRSATMEPALTQGVSN